MMRCSLSMLILVLMHVGKVKTDERECPLLACDPSTFSCPFRSFFAIAPSRTICRGCNVCIKPGSTVDSTGCPQLACREDLARGACRQPWVRNSWIDYHGRQCKTCEALLCNM